MNSYDFVHLTLAVMDGELKGRTKLQKTVYFLGVMTDSLGDLGYRAHFYGPYSDDVADAVDQLKSLGFVDQNVASGGAFDASGFEVARYDYALTAQGKAVAEQKKQQYPQEFKKMRDAAAILKKAKSEDYVQLSVAAKTYFMLGERKGNASSLDDLAHVAGKFGWSVTNEQVKEAAQYLKKLGLMKVSPR